MYLPRYVVSTYLLFFLKNSTLKLAEKFMQLLKKTLITESRKGRTFSEFQGMRPHMQPTTQKLLVFPLLPRFVTFLTIISKMST